MQEEPNFTSIIGHNPFLFLADIFLRDIMGNSNIYPSPYIYYTRNLWLAENKYFSNTLLLQREIDFIETSACVVLYADYNNLDLSSDQELY
jgi:hypothetical protein